MSTPTTTDLTTKLAPHLDPHLVFRLLAFLKTNDLYPERDLLTAQLEVVSTTNMVDVASELREQLGSSSTDDAEKRETVLNQREELKKKCSKLLEIVENEELVHELRSSGNLNMEYLRETYELDGDVLDGLLEYARFEYTTGAYAVASAGLGSYLALSGLSSPNRLSALWGKLASDILAEQWASANATREELSVAIEKHSHNDSLQLLQQRSWLLHWSLFVFFNIPGGRHGLVDTFLQDRYLGTIQTSCPYLLRYLVAAVMGNARRRSQVRETVRAIRRESTYHGPFTRLLEALHVRFDFDEAHAILEECKTVINQDFFMQMCGEELYLQAKQFLFNTYCRIHSVVELDSLAERLSMERGEAESWIEDLIRQTRLNAKIDSEAGLLVMRSPQTTAYQKLASKVGHKGLALNNRTRVLENNLKKL